MLSEDDEAYEEIPLDFTATGGARSVLRIAVDADYLALVDVSTDVLEVSVNDGSFRRLRLGAVIRPRRAVRKITVRNPSGGVVTGTLAYGKGSYIDNRVIVASGSGGTLPVGSADGALISIGATADAAATTDAGTFSLIALIKRLLAKLPTIGQQAVASSMSVTLATSHPSITMTGTPAAGFGATTKHHAISAATTNATVVKASAGSINALTISNGNAAARYFKLYDKASAPVVGTDTPVMTVLVPPVSTLVLDLGAYGLRNATGIAYALTTGIAVADTGAVGTDLSVFINYT